MSEESKPKFKFKIAENSIEKYISNIYLKDLFTFNYEEFDDCKAIVLSEMISDHGDMYQIQSPED